VYVTACVSFAFLCGIGASAVSLNALGDWHWNFVLVAAAYVGLLYGHDLAYGHELEVRRDEVRRRGGVEHGPSVAE